MANMLAFAPHQQRRDFDFRVVGQVIPIAAYTEEQARDWNNFTWFILSANLVWQGLVSSANRHTYTSKGRKHLAEKRSPDRTGRPIVVPKCHRRVTDL